MNNLIISQTSEYDVQDIGYNTDDWTSRGRVFSSEQAARDYIDGVLSATWAVTTNAEIGFRIIETIKQQSVISIDCSYKTGKSGPILDL
jgi:fructose-bisphosphate aldolase class 1